MSIGVSVLHEDALVLDDLAYALGRCEGLHLAGLGEVRDADVVLSSAKFLDAARSGATRGLVVLSCADPLADARAGFDAGARGLLRWPDDAADLPRLVAAAALGASANAPEGRVVAVHGARGGAGASTVSCLLAGAITGSVLVDLSGSGQLAWAAEGSGGSLERAIASPLPEVVRAACEPHAAGRALLSRPGAPPPDARALATLLGALRRAAAIVVCDAGSLGAPVREATATVVVCADDLASLRTARAWLDAGGDGLIVLNRLRRRGLRARHVAKALGRAPVAVMPPDRRLARAADLGVLPSGRFPRRFTRALLEKVET